MFSSKDIFFGSQSTGFTVSKSLRFRSSASAYLNRTFGTPTDNKKWTYSVWMKKAKIATGQSIMSSNVDGPEYWDMSFNTSDQISIQNRVGSTNLLLATTTAVFRDPSAWYHIVFVFDSANATAAYRNRLYVNGVEYTISANSGSGNASAWNVSGVQHNIGVSRTLNTSGAIWLQFDGNESEVNFVDGSALTPSSFGAYDTNGIWQPAAYTGSYGNNGFYLKFTDVGATSGSNTGYGKDFAGTNYWTTNNFGTTSTDTTYDSMLDSPTNATGDIGNYPVLNPLDTGGTAPSAANLQLTAGAAERGVRSTFAIPTSGLWYGEATVGTNQSGATDIGFGFAASTVSLTANPSGLANVWGLYGTATTNITRNGTGTLAGAGTALTSGEILQFAIDLTNNKGWIGRGNVWFNGTTGTNGDPATGANPTFTFSSPPTLFPWVHGYSSTIDINFGQRPFTYTPPSGYSALNTQNLSTPTITNGAQYMAAVTYTGNGTTTGDTQTITASSTNSGNNPNSTTFQPDFVWIKSRSSGVQFNILNDSVRGTNKIIYSNSTDVELSTTNVFNSFNSDGFTAAYNSTFSNTVTNANGSTYVAWEWKAGGTGVSNTSGSITSTVSANTSAGFSVVTWTGNGTAGSTIGHGLNATPSMIIVKRRDGVAIGWPVGHTSIGWTNQLELNATTASQAYGGFNNTTPGASTFTVSGSSSINANGNTYVAYCFAPVAGYSAFGSYTGNGSADGPFIYLGFRPRWIMIKQTTASGTNWIIIDTSRSTYNVTTVALGANSSLDEPSFTTTEWLDVLSNGFKIKIGSANGAYTNLNISGNTYIYAAFAENPFKISRAR